MPVITTERLILREVILADAEFILELYNEPSYIEGIGDKQIYTIDKAIEYIANTFTQSYQDNGYGMYLVTLIDVGTPIGICGLIRRDYRDDLELGYGFSKAFWSNGYANEAASSVLEYGKSQLNAKEFIAVTSMSNQASIKTLIHLGFTFNKIEKLAAYKEESRLFKLSVE